MSLIRPMASALLTAAALAAQCPYQTATATEVGAPCNYGTTGLCAVAPRQSRLFGALDVATCEVTFRVDALGSCGVDLPLQILVLGVQSTALPVPPIGTSCTLWVQPLATLVDTDTVFQLPLPPGPLQPLTVYAQAVVVHRFLGEVSLTMTDGIALALQ